MTRPIVVKEKEFKKWTDSEQIYDTEDFVSSSYDGLTILIFLISQNPTMETWTVYGHSCFVA